MFKNSKSKAEWINVDQTRQRTVPAGHPHLVAEDLDLSVGPVNWPAAAAVVAVGVDLDCQRHPFHALLRGEVCAQTVHGDEDLENKNKTYIIQGSLSCAPGSTSAVERLKMGSTNLKKST